MKDLRRLVATVVIVSFSIAALMGIAALLVVVALMAHAADGITPVADILKAAEAALGGGGAQVQASVDAAVRMPACSQPLLGTALGPRMAEVRCPDASGWRLTVPARVRRDADVVVLIAPVQAGATFDAAQLAVQHRDVAGGSGVGMSDPAQVAGHGEGAAGLHVAHGPAQGGIGAVALGGGGQIHGGVRQGDARLRQTHELRRLPGVHGHPQSPAVRQADVLAGGDDDAPGDEPEVLAGVEHFGQPVKRGVRVAASDAFDKGADSVVVGVAVAVGWAAGYFFYEYQHMASHLKAPRTRYQRWLRKHHLHHHFGHPMANHGVTVPWWDRAFGTLERPEQVRVPRRMAQLTR